MLQRTETNLVQAKYQETPIITFIECNLHAIDDIIIIIVHGFLLF